MIAIIRITGQVKVRKDIDETFKRLKLKRKYSCVLIEETKENLGMLKKLRNFVSYGNIDEKTLEEMKKKRDKGKGYFALHPPRGGIKTKIHYPKGVLGENKKINELIMRML